MRNHISLVLIISILLSLFLNGCYFSRFGQADVTPFRIKSPEGLVGLTKSQVIDRLGLPEGGIIDEKGTEYWEYNNTSNYYVIAYGKGKHKNLILKIENTIVVDVYLIEKGASYNFLTGGM